MHALRPLDFTGKMQNRWSYACAFGAMTPFVIEVVFSSKMIIDVPDYLKGTLQWNPNNFVPNDDIMVINKKKNNKHTLVVQYFVSCERVLITCL